MVLESNALILILAKHNRIIKATTTFTAIATRVFLLLSIKLRLWV